MKNRVVSATTFALLYSSSTHSAHPYSKSAEINCRGSVMRKWQGLLSEMRGTGSVRCWAFIRALSGFVKLALMRLWAHAHAHTIPTLLPLSKYSRTN
eukprot:1147004-Pelagomonas_calceolata.AAC.10